MVVTPPANSQIQNEKKRKQNRKKSQKNQFHKNSNLYRVNPREIMSGPRYPFNPNLTLHVFPPKCVAHQSAFRQLR